MRQEDARTAMARIQPIASVGLIGVAQAETWRTHASNATADNACRGRDTDKDVAHTRIEDVLVQAQEHLLSRLPPVLPT